MCRPARLIAATLLGLAGLSLFVWLLEVGGPDVASEPAAPPAAAQVAEGAYLARAGNCMPCHSQRGGAPFAGGRVVETPFGNVVSGNLTPDMQTGLGRWSADDFWRAMHQGESRDGHFLLPVFPYGSYTGLVRADSDALFAYLRSLAPVTQTNAPHQLRWPFGTQAALAIWRALYFRPAQLQAEPERGTAWNRGAYLVQVLGHCNECHAPRNLFGAPDASRSLSGGLIPQQSWFAPSLRSVDQAGVAHWSERDIVALLGTGVSARGSASGPMAEVVLHGSQYLSAADLSAMAVYLQSLRPAQAGASDTRDWPVDRPSASRGAKLYQRHCAECHADDGGGVPGAYPPLAGNRAVQLANATNLVQIILWGGFAPATQGNPRPYGMPPFQILLDDRDIADLLNYIRSAWGNRAGAVSERDVARYRQPGR